MKHPTTIGFATANRSAVIRVPAYAKAPEEKRFELRSIDATLQSLLRLCRYLNGWY